MNSITIMGRITKDLELKQTGSGIAFCNFSVAVDRRVQKDKPKTPDFFTVTAWRGQAEIVAKYFHKGSRILIRGTMQSRSYEQDGRQITAWDLMAEDIYFVDSKSDNTQQAPAQAQPMTPPPVSPQAALAEGYADPGIPDVEVEDVSQLPFDY